MSIIGLNNAPTQYELFTVFNSLFQTGKDLGLADSVGMQIAMQMNAPTRTVRFNFTGSWPKIEAWKGEKTFGGLKTYKYDLTHERFQTGLVVDRDDIVDGMTGMLQASVQESGMATADFVDTKVFGMLENTTALCYDEQPFFSASHPIGESNFGGGSTASNVDTSGSTQKWYLMDLSRPLKPIIMSTLEPFQFSSRTEPTSDPVWNRLQYEYSVDGRAGFGYGLWQTAYRSNKALNWTNIDAARLSMRQLTDDRGRILRVRPTHLIVPNSLESTALELMSENVSKTASAPTSLTQAAARRLQLIVSDYLSNAT